MLANANGNENVPKNIITGDETWSYEYDVETEMQLSQWTGKGSPPLKKASVAPCSGTGEHLNVNIIYSLMNAGQSKCTSISQSNINQQICTILLKLVNVSCHLVY